MNVPTKEFENIVAEALDSLPKKFRAKMHNVAIFVEDFPSKEQRQKLGIKNKYGLLGLFEGYYQSSRRNFGPVLPDRITIFRVPIIQSCSTPEQCRQQVISTVKHEIAHHFGSGESGAREAGRK